MRKKCLYIVCILLFSMSSEKAHAYLDPGTGSVMIQVFLGMLLGFVFVVKMFWHKVANVFRNMFFGKEKKENGK